MIDIFKDMNFHRIEYKDYSININIGLLEKKGKLDNLPELEKIYIELYKVFDEIEHTENRIQIYHLNKSIEDIEFKMQELWGFPVDRNMHRYWYECPKCSCPQYDNYESRGTEFRHYNSECIIHGTETLNLVNRENKLKRIIYNK